MHTISSQRRLLWRLTAIVLFLLIALPADARPSRRSTSALSSGDINPTSVPVVDDDFTGLEALSVAADPTLLESVNVNDYIDTVLRGQIRAVAANKVARGDGIVVAVLDAGFTLDHPAFAGHVSEHAWDFIDDDPYPDDYGDGKDNNWDGIVDRAVGHGTMVAAMVLNSAPNATILPLRVRDDEGLGTDKPVIMAIQYAIDHKVDVINLSIDVDKYDEDMVWWAVQDAQAMGIVVVASAGNDGLMYLPIETVLTANLIVGAVDREDVLAPFSNYDGYKQYYGKMIFAPGIDLVGPMIGEGYYTRGSWSGTSFAAGVVSGGVALLKQLHPDWDPETLGWNVAQSVNRAYRADGTLLPYGRINLLRVVAK